VPGRAIGSLLHSYGLILNNFRDRCRIGDRELLTWTHCGPDLRRALSRNPLIEIGGVAVLAVMGAEYVSACAYDRVAPSGVRVPLGLIPVGRLGDREHSCPAAGRACRRVRGPSTVPYCRARELAGAVAVQAMGDEFPSKAETAYAAGGHGVQFCGVG